MSKKLNFFADIYIYLFIIALLLIGLLTFNDYGISRDYVFHDYYGRFLVDYYTSFGVDKTAVTDPMRIYGGLFELFASIFRFVFPIEYYSSKHLSTFIFSLLAVLAVYKINSLIVNKSAGLLASLFLVTTPMYYGHSFINHKDIPYAATYALSLWAIIENLYTPKKYKFFLLGVCAGATMAIRPGMILIFPLISIPFIYDFYDKVWIKKNKINKNYIVSFLTIVSFTSLGFLLTLSIGWPYFHDSPIEAIKTVLPITTKFYAHGNVLYWGTPVSIRDLPSMFIFSWLLIQLPEIFLLSLFTFILLLPIYLIKKSQNNFKLSIISISTLLISIFLPISAIIFAKSVIYDGIRHLLFIIPALSCIASIGLIWCFEKCLTVKKLFFILTVVLFSIPVIRMSQLHPYQYAYFNDLVLGSTSGATKKFDTEYWSTCLRESVLWLKKYNGNQQRTFFSYGDPLQVRPYINSNDYLQYTELENKAFYYIAIDRDGAINKPNYTLIHTISRINAPFCFIYETNN
jgi:hypothetical protein